MMRNLVISILLSAVSSGAMSLGLGNIELNSGLNQPFNARIELLSPTASELDSLTVSLADIDAFERAGIDRAFILSSLRFEVIQSETGRDYIQVTSRESLREPFLNFLIMASWSNGRLYREYTVLLDPPLYDPNAGRAASVDTGPRQTSPVSIQSMDTGGSQPSSGASAQAFSSYTGNEVGPIASSETLWSVASRVRPDSSVSVNQMMLALLRANPDAFIGNNINGLRQGQILRVPGMDEITSTSYQDAITEVSSQNAMWDEVRGTIAANTASRPVSTAVVPVQNQSSATVTAPESELRLVAAGNQSTDTGQSTGTMSTAGNDAAIELMNEQLESMTSENADLRSRLTESETIIQDLRRLIELKDDELATIQQQVGGAPVAESTTENVDDETSGETTIDPQEGTAQSEAAIEPDMATTPEESEAVAEMTIETEASAPAEPESAVETTEEAVTEVMPEPVAVTQADSSSDQSIIDQILTFVFGNIVLVGGVLLALILAGLIPGFLRKRREAGSQTESSPLSDFPDFDSSAVGPDVTEGPQIDIEIDKEIKDAHGSMPAEVIGITADRQPAQLAPAPAAPAPEAAEEDPLAEVNVFLAYEHFDSAEEFVRDAIKRQPANLDFHSKLLEVFYSAGDKQKYEEEARVLHDLVAGSGPHWDMATIMWQEMSPNRPLFAEAADGDDDVKADITGSRGIVDLTADEAESDDDAGLDFDLGMAMEDSASSSKSGETEDMLDITAGSDDVLDVTASESSNSDDEDILDVTAAVGLDTAEVGAGDDNNFLDLPSSDDQDILDISASGTEDLLDVTAHSDLESDDNEDVLDISSAGSGVDESLEFTGSQAGAQADENSVDFDIGGISFEPAVDSAQETAASGADDGGIELDFGSDTSTDEGSLEFSMDSDGQDNDGGIELDFDSDDTPAEDGSLELSLDSNSQDNDGGIELDFASADESDAKSDAFEVDLSFDNDAVAAAGIDMDSTVKIPKGSELSLDSFDSDDDDDDGDHTVFVPRTADTGEQSNEDENATKLDLAKAYVELGDDSNAKSILEEVIADGNPAQRRQAQELMAQIT